MSFGVGLTLNCTTLTVIGRPWFSSFIVSLLLFFSPFLEFPFNLFSALLAGILISNCLSRTYPYHILCNGFNKLFYKLENSVSNHWRITSNRKKKSNKLSVLHSNHFLYLHHTIQLAFSPTCIVEITTHLTPTSLLLLSHSFFSVLKILIWLFGDVWGVSLCWPDSIRGIVVLSCYL